MKTTRFRITPPRKLAGERGFEPLLHGPEPCVLPLDDSPATEKRDNCPGSSALRLSLHNQSSIQYSTFTVTGSRLYLLAICKSSGYVMNDLREVIIQRCYESQN